MRSRLLAGFCVAVILVLLVLFAQTADAATKVYVNFGPPVVEVEYRAYDHPSYRDHEVRRVVPAPRHYWVQGYYRCHRYERVWVPGHWEKMPAYREHVRAPRCDRYGAWDRKWDRDREQGSDRDNRYHED